MKHIAHIFLSLAILLVAGTNSYADYVDHRFHNVDSLERVLASHPYRLYPEKADTNSLKELVLLYRDLYLGYLQTNGERCVWYARQAMRTSRMGGWPLMVADGARIIGQHHWAEERYDSAAIYFKKALDAVDEMSHMPRYDEYQVDNMYSVCYGALGNLNVDRDSIETALHYYSLAGELFEKHDWNEQLCILYGNESELYRRLGEKRKALEMAKTSRNYAEQTGDSLMLAMSAANLAESWAGLRRYGKAVKCSREAYSYFNSHKREEAIALSESLETLSDLYRKERVWGWVAFAILLFAASLIGAITIMQRRIKAKAETKRLAAEAEAQRSREARMLRAEKRREAAKTSNDQSDLPRIPSQIQDIKLNDREREILSLLAQGMTSAQIGEKIFLSTGTINWYRNNLLNKFQVKNTAGLLSKIAAYGITKDEEQ